MRPPDAPPCPAAPACAARGCWARPQCPCFTVRRMACRCGGSTTPLPAAPPPLPTWHLPPPTNLPGRPAPGGRHRGIKAHPWRHGHQEACTGECQGQGGAGRCRKLRCGGRGAPRASGAAPMPHRQPPCYPVPQIAGTVITVCAGKLRGARPPGCKWGCAGQQVAGRGCLCGCMQAWLHSPILPSYLPRSHDLHVSAVATQQAAGGGGSTSGGRRGAGSQWWCQHWEQQPAAAGAAAAGAAFRQIAALCCCSQDLNPSSCSMIHPEQRFNCNTISICFVPLLRTSSFAAFLPICLCM